MIEYSWVIKSNNSRWEFNVELKLKPSFVCEQINYLIEWKWEEFVSKFQVENIAFRGNVFVIKFLPSSRRYNNNTCKKKPD